MKSYDYNGNLNEDIKNLDKKNYIKWILLSVCSTLAECVCICIILLLLGTPIFLKSILIMCSVFMSLNAALAAEIKMLYKKQSGNRIEYLNKDINRDIEISMTRIKECITIEKREKVLENMDSSIPVMSKEEKIVNYFYLLDPKEQIQVLKQIKGESLVYLLEEEDIKRENIEIPVEKTLVLKK